MSEHNDKAQVEDQKPVVNKSRMIGNYLVGKTLGEGTFGKVKQGTHQLTGEKVAIKILEKDRIIEVADVERVQREIHILKLVRHPHVIQLYEIIETPKHIFLVMEYISGGELFDYIVKNTKLKEVEACKFFQELISGVEYLHKIKVVHRDLKPENLLLDNNKNIKIVDYGLSNTYKLNETLKTACGSPCYAAPEMIAGQKYTGLKVDLWSCGVILFASLCGYLPFEDQNTSALYKKILSGDYMLPKFVSSESADIIRNVLNTDPASRFGIEEIRKHEWTRKYKRNYEIPPGIVVGYNRIPVDPLILNQLEQYGFQLDYAQKCLDANKHNHVTTTYHLLLKRHLMQGGQSTADLNSQNFDIKLLEPRPRPQKPPISTLVNNEVIRQQNKEDQKDRQRSYSNEKEKYYEQLVKRSNHHGYRLSDTGSSNDANKQIIQEHDTSVLRMDHGPQSVQGKGNKIGNNTIDELYGHLPNTGGKQNISVSPVHYGNRQIESRSVPKKNDKPLYGTTKTNPKAPSQPATQLYNPVYKNRQIMNTNQIKLKNQLQIGSIDQNVRRQSSKSKRLDNTVQNDVSVGYRSQKNDKLMEELVMRPIQYKKNTSQNQKVQSHQGHRQYAQSNDARGTNYNYANISFDLVESGRINYASGNYSAKSKRVARPISLDRKNHII